MFLLFEEFKQDPILNVLLFLSYVSVEFFLVEGYNVFKDLVEEPNSYFLIDFRIKAFP